MYKYCPEKKKKLQNNSYINKNRFNQFNNCFFTFLKKIFFFLQNLVFLKQFKMVFKRKNLFFF